MGHRTVDTVYVQNRGRRALPAGHAADDPAGEMASKIFSLFDEYQSKENGKHTLRAMQENARQGFCNGSRPHFGFKTVESPALGQGQRKKRPDHRVRHLSKVRHTMSVLALWKSSPDLLEGKTAKQILAISGNGKLAEDGPTSLEFRALLAELPSEVLAKFAVDCLEEAFVDSGLVLQDIVNEMGVRLGMQVAHGRYRGRQGVVGNDGLWTSPSGQCLRFGTRLTVQRAANDADGIGVEGAFDFNQRTGRTGIDQWRAGHDQGHETEAVHSASLRVVVLRRCGLSRKPARVVVVESRVPRTELRFGDVGEFGDAVATEVPPRA